MDDVQNNVYDADKIKSIKKEFSRIGFSLTVYLLLVFAMQLLITFVVGILAGLLSSPGFSAFSENGWYTWIVTYLPQVLIAAPVCFLMLRLKGPQEAFEGNLGGADYSKIIVASIPVMYIGNILGYLVTSIFDAGNVLESIITSSNIWATLLFAVVLAPLVEELIFRKLVISRLKKYGDRTAILVSALLFALMHGNLSQFFYAFGLGLLLGYVYARTGKLRYSIGLHMIINFMGSFVGILILRLSESLDLPALSNMNPADYASVFESLGAKIWLLLAIGLYGFVIFSLFIAGLVFLIRGRKQVVLTEGTVMIPKPGRAAAIFGNAGMIVYLVVCFAVIVLSLFVKL